MKKLPGSESPGDAPSPSSAASGSPGRLSFPVVAIGASAGGVEAIKILLKSLPSDTKAALVVISHTPMRVKSRLAEVLASHTAIKVQAVTGSTAVTPGTVYTMPSGRDMIIKNGTLKLVAPGKEPIHRPIDRFLASLAEDQGTNAVCIILTGAGSDGSSGLRSISSHGGLVVVQDPGSAMYNSMPESAVHTGLADVVLRLEEIGPYLRRLLTSPLLELFSRTDLQTISDYAELSRKIMDLLREHTGHDLSGYKQSTISRRIHKRMILSGHQLLSTYAAELEKNREERARLFNDLLIGVTSFFRDEGAFNVLREQALEGIFHGKGPGDTVRVWVAGCSSGQEAYSLAILLDEYVKLAEAKCEIKIFASDIDQKALAEARKGAYSARAKHEISPLRLDKYFQCSAKTCTVNSEIRDRIVFAYHDLLQDPPFIGMDLIVCRNVLIYLRPEGQKMVLAKLAYALNSGGFLLLGPAESIGGEGNLLETVDKKWRLYKRKGTLNSQAQLPLLGTVRRISFDAALLDQAGHDRPKDPEVVAEKAMLRRFGRPGALLDTNLRVLHFIGDTSPFLGLPEGEPSLNILKLAKRGLRLHLRSAIQAVMDTKQSSLAGNVRLGGSGMAVNIFVDPVLGEAGTLDAMLVIFEQCQAPEGEEACQVVEIPDSSSLIARYEAELSMAGDHIQRLVERYETLNEELKASNEELVSMNEELQASNEELDASREELQSLNEELSSINTELQAKVEELALANSFVENLLKSTNAAKVVLDQDLKLVRHTQAAQELFLLLPTDAGQPVEQLKRMFEDQDLVTDCRQVLETGRMVEREILAHYGRWFLKRVYPFLSPKGEVAGVVLTFNDVTKLKEAEEVLRRSNEELEALIKSRTEELRNSELKLRTVADFTYDWEYWRAPSGELVWISPSCERITGYSVTEFLADSSLVERIVHPDDFAAFHDHLQETMAGGLEPSDMDFRIIHRSGQVVWINHHCREITLDSGTNLGRRVSNRDITDRKLAEQEVRSWAKFPEENPNLVMRVGRDMKVTLANPASDGFLQYFHSGPGQAFPEPLAGQVALAFRTGLIQEFEAHVGESILAFSATPILEEGYVNLYGLDITRRKQAEESLRASEELFRRLVEGAPEMVFVQSRGLFAYLNPAALATFGAKTQEELLGRPVVERFPPHYRAAVAERIRQLNEDIKPQPPMEHPYLKLDHSEGFIEVAAVPIVWKGENGALVFARDVSERRQARLELEKAKEAAEAGNKAKGEFLANMSHELRTPLNGVLGMLQLMERDQRLSAEQKSLLGTAMESGRGLLTIINDILSFVQLEAGKMPISRDQVDLREIMDSICRAFRYEASAKGLALSASVADTVPTTILSDAGRLRQILFNLLGNSMKFTDRGRVTVQATALPLSSVPEDRILLFTVSDTGIGIPDDKTSVIFEPFTQADSSLTRKYQGTGIGLGIVRLLVKLMGGSICLDSNLGQGTTIYFTIHCGWASPIPPSPRQSRPETAAPLAGLRVLVAEDDHVNMVTATRFLEHLGCKVLGAENGRQALELLAKHDFDLVILDIQMPEMNGMEAAMTIRSSHSLGEKAKIPILAMTAHAMPGDREQFLGAGMNGYIAKPMELRELQRTIQAMLQKDAS